MSRLNVVQWGDSGAPVVVCLHGITSHAVRFRRLAVERLALRFRVVALDLRGHGYSNWEPPWDLGAHVGDVLETVDELGLEQPDWIGHSFGGRLVIELAAHAPERVGRAVLLDPAVWVPPPVALERAEAMRRDESFASPAEAVERRLAEGGALLAARALLEEELPEHLVLGDDGRYRYRYARSAVIAAYGEMAKSPPLSDVRVPTLILRAIDSEVLPEPLVDTCRELIAGPLEVVTVPGGHIVMWDAFDETADAIEAFLAP